MLNAFYRSMSGITKSIDPAIPMRSERKAPLQINGITETADSEGDRNFTR